MRRYLSSESNNSNNNNYGSNSNSNNNNNPTLWEDILRRRIPNAISQWRVSCTWDQDDKSMFGHEYEYDP